MEEDKQEGMIVYFESERDINYITAAGLIEHEKWQFKLQMDISVRKYYRSSFKFHTKSWRSLVNIHETAPQLVDLHHI